MTKRERVLRTTRFEQTDRIPIFDFVDSNALREHFGGKSLTSENAWELEYAAIRHICDAARGIIAPTLSPHRTTDEDGFVTYHDYETSWIESRPFNDVAGLKEWVLKDIERARAWKPDDAFVRAYRDEIERHQAGIGDDTVIVTESDVGLEDRRDKAGLELFSYLSADEPELVSEWLAALNEKEVRKARAIGDPDLVPIVLVHSDIAYKTGLIHSPDWLRESFIPLATRLIDTYHEMGIVCLYHSDGNLWEILGDLVEAGIDGLNPLETMAGMTMKEVRSRHPSLFIAGGIDVSQLLTMGTPDEVHHVCVQTIRDAGCTGYLMGSTTELLPTVRVENVLAMLDVAEHWKKYV